MDRSTTTGEDLVSSASINYLNVTINHCLQVLCVWFFHSYCLHRLYARKSFSPILFIIQFLLVLDVIEITMVKPHNLLCEVYREEIFPFFYLRLLTFIILFRWYSILTMLPFVGVLTIASLVHPLFYRHLSKTRTAQMLCAVLVLPIGLVIPQYFPCCGHMFYIPGYYFTLDRSKPATVYFSTLNWVLQGFCLAFSSFSDLYLMHYIHKNNRIRKQTMAASVSSLATKTGAVPVNAPRPAKEKHNHRISPNTRLALSFVVYSGGFILGTVSHNFLTRLPPSTFITVLNLVFNQSQYVKFGAYAFIPKG